MASDGTIHLCLLCYKVIIFIYIHLCSFSFLRSEVEGVRLPLAVASLPLLAALPHSWSQERRPRSLGLLAR